MESHEKKTTLYKEQNSEKVEAYIAEIKDILPEKIAYVDESGIDINTFIVNMLMLFVEKQ